MYNIVFEVDSIELQRRVTHFLKYYTSKERIKNVVICICCQRKMSKLGAFTFTNTDKSVDYICPVCV